MSLAKKKEVFEVQYMSLRHFVTKPRAAIYTILGVLAIFGLITAGLSYLTSGKIEDLTGVLMVFLATSLSGFVYIYLIQVMVSRKSYLPLCASTYNYELIYIILVYIFVTL